MTAGRHFIYKFFGKSRQEEFILEFLIKSRFIQGFFFGHHYAQNRNFRLRLPSTFLNNLFWNVPMKATPKHKNLETTLSFNLGTLETQCEARQ